MARTSFSANDVDIGARIRLARQQRSLSQQALANSLRLSFQQVQKYEKGTNHVSAVRLHQIAHVLGVGMDYFFESLEAEAPKGGQARASHPISSPAELVRTSEALALVTTFNKIKSPTLRKKCLALVRSLAEED